MTKFYSSLVPTGRRFLFTWNVLLGMFLLFSIQTNAQTAGYTFENVPLNTVMSQISAKTGYQFVYDAELVKKAKLITVKVAGNDIRAIMNAVVKGQDFNYEISENKTIILTSIKKSSAEEYTIHGMVTDSTGMSLPGASVRVKNGRSVTTTDANGHFNINVSSANNTLLVNYIGYLQTERSFEKSASTGIVTIQVKSNSSLLDEVVVNGFQSISKERSTAAVTIIDNKKLNENINVDLLSALEGRVAGLAYRKNVNGIGADQPMLRGQGTFQVLATAVGTAPLVVIDGLPTETTLEEINPYDIETVTVLKDAAASSIYGSRSANGVIVLTTKKGSGPVKISFNADFFVDPKPSFNAMHYASTADVLAFETDVYNKERARYATTETMFNAYGTAANGSIRYYTPLYQLYRDRDAGKLSAGQVADQLSNWSNNDYQQQYRDQVWQTAFRQRYNLSVSSATSKSNTFTSINYDNSKLRTKYNKDDNLTMYFKNTYNVNKWLTTTFGVNGSYATSTATDGDYNSYDFQPRYSAITNADGSLVYADYINMANGAGAGGLVNGAVVSALAGNSQFRSYSFNILESLEEGQTKRNSLAIRAFANIQARITKGLNFSSQVQYQNNTLKAETYYDADSYKIRNAYNALTGYNTVTGAYSHALPVGGRFSQNMQQSNSYTFRNQLSFDRSFGPEGKHSLTAIAGFEMRQTMSPIGMDQISYGYDPVTLTSVALNNFDLAQTGAPSYIYGNNQRLGFVATTQKETKHRYMSSFANAGYTYANRYNITGSVRIDQADLFGVDPKFKNRPLWSGGLGWNISNEKFMSKVSWVSLLKFRTTYGINGNIDQSGSKYLVANRRSDNLFPSLQYLNITTLPNPYLRWEKTATVNAGLDYALFSNRLRGSIDVYSKKSTDLLVATDLDPTVGASSRVINNGALANKGIEFSVGGDWYKSDGLTLSSQFIIGFNKNKIGRVNNAIQPAYNYISSPSTYYIEGSAINTLYAYRYGGMTNGYPYFLDENGKATLEFDASGNPVVASSKTVNNFTGLVKMGSLTPTYTGSFSQRVSYKSFDLSALMVFSGGNVMRKDVLSLSSNEINDVDINQRWTNGATPSTPRLLVDYAENMVNRASDISTMWRNADVNVIKGDYLKLRSISLGYSLPQTITRKIHVASARLTGQVNNLWYLSAAGDDIDPEYYSSNSGTRTLQNPKSFVVGFNLTF